MKLMRNLNIKQKKILIITLVLIVISLIVWQLYGGEFWTKSKVLVEIKDDLFDTTYREYQDKFVLGLDYTLLFDGFVFVAGLIGTFLVRTKKKA